MVRSRQYYLGVDVSSSWRGVDRLQSSAHVSESEGHSGVPWCTTRHLRRVIGNENAIVASRLKDPQDAQHVDLAVVDESFAVMRHFSTHVAKVDVRELALPTVLLRCRVDVAFGHFGERAQAEFQGIRSAWTHIEKSLKHIGLI